MRFRLQFAARCCSISAIAISSLVGSSVDAVQFSYGQTTSQNGAYGAYGSAATVAQNQGYATSRPFQADPTGSNYQSMSPDSWGNSGASGVDPFSSPRPAAPLNNSATAGSGPSSQFGPRTQNAPTPYAYGQTPAFNPPGQYQPPAYANQQVSEPQYESTGAPSVQTLLGNQGSQQLPVPRRATPPSPFRPAEFDSRDPKDIPLAPTIPSSILDVKDNRLDSTKPAARENAAPSNVSTAAPQTGIELEPPGNQLPTEKKAIPDLLSGDDSVLGKFEIPDTPSPQDNSQPSELQLDSPTPFPAESSDQTLSNPPAATPTQPTPTQPTLTQPAPTQPLSDLYPTTNAQPFSNPSPATSYPTTNAQPFSNPSPATSYPTTNAQPFFPPTQAQQVLVPPAQAPLNPYQMPAVFDAVPANQPALAPANVAPQTGAATGFGWGNAPGVFQRNAQLSQPLQPQAAQQVPPDSKPKFPLPFGLGSKLFGNKLKKKDSQLDFTQPKSPLSGGQKQVDPNTYPPQPMPHSQLGTSQTSASPAQMPNAQFRPDLAQRAPFPTVRNPGTYDSGKTEYDFENKKREFPPFSEILATGQYFASIEGQFLKPRFNGNSGIAILDQTGGSNSTDSQVFDFDYELIPSFRVGFESKYGPGFEIDYRILRTASVVQSFTSGAGTSGSLRSALPDSSLSSVISTTAPGQTLSGAHTLNLESIGFSVFKEVQLPVTRISGMFGFQAMDIDHQVDATVVDGAGGILQSLNSRSDMRAFGPRIRLEYYRPVGHTPLEFVTHAGGSLLFGKRDQFIVGQGTDSFQRVGTDEIVTNFEFLTALQIKQRIGENRSVFARIGYLNQVFNSGGSGFLAQDDFGLRGITFLIGINR